MPAQAAACSLRLLYACSGYCMPAQAAVCLLRLLLPWSQYTLLYCKTNSASLPLCNTNSATTHPSCNTIRALQYNGSTTNLLIAIPFQPLYSPYHNTIVVLQHKISHSSIANLQYTLYCNTKPLLLQYNWAVAQISSAQIFFFSHFHQ